MTEAALQHARNMGFTMTYEELLRVARRRGLVQWFPSRAIERVRLASYPNPYLKRFGVRVWAHALFEDDGGHPIYPNHRDGTPRVLYCREVQRQEKIPLEQLLPFRSL